MELSDLYSEKILDLAGNARQPARLELPGATARKVSRVCGSVIEVDIDVRGDIIVGYGHELSACALGQTSAAVVAREIVGTPVAEFLALRQTMHDMLKADGAPPSGKWGDLKYLEPVRDYPARHMSTLLVFDAVALALEKLEVFSIGCGVGVMYRFIDLMGRAIDLPFKIAAVLLITLYRYTLSAFVGRTCRHLPTCSEYTSTAIWTFGFWPGGWMGLARLWRCRPGGTHGYDPVPDKVPETGRWYLPWRYGQWRGEKHEHA